MQLALGGQLLFLEQSTSGRLPWLARRGHRDRARAFAAQTALLPAKRGSPPFVPRSLDPSTLVRVGCGPVSASAWATLSSSVTSGRFSHSPRTRRGVRPRSGGGL